jgi:hypothetical protein
MTLPTLVQITRDLAHQALALPSRLTPLLSCYSPSHLCLYHPTLPGYIPIRYAPSLASLTLPVPSETFPQLRKPSYPFGTLHICTGSPPGPSLNIFVCAHDTVVGLLLTGHCHFVIL